MISLSLFCSILLWAGVILLISGMVLLITNVIMSIRNRHSKTAGRLCFILLIVGFVLLVGSGLLYGFLGN